MASMASDTWRITPEERAKHDAQFLQLNPVSGFITGNQARTFFLQSGLPTPVLGQIWTLADMNADGKMDKKEFSIAMYLIQKKLQGHPLPAVLPLGLKQEPGQQGFGGGVFSSSSSNSSSFMFPASTVSAGSMLSSSQSTLPSPARQQQSAWASPQSSHSMPYGGASQYRVGGVSSAGGGGGIPVAGFAAAGASTMSAAPPSFSPNMSAPADGDWAVPQNQKLKFKQQFNLQDRQRKGHLTGVEARAILVQTGLPQNTLAQIWSLSDLDNDGKLSSEEFVLAMHLVELSRSGQPLPVKLPPDLVPPRFRKGAAAAPPGSAIGLPPSMPPHTGGPVSIPPPAATADAFGDLLGSGFSTGAGGGAPLMPTTTGSSIAAAEAEALSAVTFEDKRKENFNAGQAELDRRRAALKEQQEQEAEARRKFEREEQEKRDRKRLDQEMKKQQELDRQMERQRQQEAEREEQRRKAMEQKEAARREMDRQRQLEWERQRRDQLMSDKQREQSLVDQLQAQVSKLKGDLEAMDTRKVHTATQVEQARNNVAEITASIDNMRSTRDTKLADIERCQGQIQEWSLKVQGVQHERQALDAEVEAITGAYDHTYKAVLHSHSSKQKNISDMKQRLKDMQEETEEKRKEIEQTNAQLKELKEKLAAVKETHGKLQAERTDKKIAWLKKKGVPIPEDKPQNGKASDWMGASSFDKPSAASNEWGATTTDNWASQDGRKSVDDLWADFGSKDLFSTGAGGVKTDLFTNHSKSADLFSSKHMSTTSTAGPNIWGDDFFASSATTVKSVINTKSEQRRSGFKKYQGLYQFDARNEDELSFMPGDIVWVKDDQTGTEQDWLAGEKDGSQGVFPAAYAAPVEGEEEDASKPSNGVSSGGGGTATAVADGDNFFASGFDASTDDKVEAASENTGSAILTASIDSSFTAVPPSMTDSTTSASGTDTQAVALYAWRAKKDNHLSFDAGDVIRIKEQQDVWYFGELNGQTGWFPQSHVKFMGAATKPAVVTASGNDLGEAPQVPTASSATPAAAAATQPTQPTQQTQPATTTAPGGELYMAVYTYSSTEPGDLTFAQGEIVLVTNTQSGDWCTGEIPGTERKGIFPANYVRKLEEEEKSSLTSPTIPTVNIQPPPTTTQAAVTLSASPSPAAAAAAGISSISSGGSSQRPDLSLSLRCSTPGESTAVSAAKQAAAPAAPAAASTTPAAASAAPASVTSPPLSPAATANAQTSSKLGTSGKKPEIATVIAAYQGTSQEQLSLSPGQLIQIRKRSDSGWWEGELQARGQKRKIGWFPANYVKLLGAGSSARSTPDPSGRSSHLSASPAPGESTSRSATPVSYPAPTTAPPAVEQVVALYTYEAQNADEMSFSKSSVINVLDNSDPDWWKGELNGQTGLFPSNYVSKLSEQQQS